MSRNEKLCISVALSEMININTSVSWDSRPMRPIILIL